MGAVLVHIDLEGDRPHPASLAALAAGRLVASSWGATLYAAFVAHDPIEAAQEELARAGADKIVLARTDVPLAPLWLAVGTAWQGVLDHLRPRLVLFGADSPSAPELGPRTASRLGARLLSRARAVGVDDVELRDRDGGYVRATDSGAAVVMIGGPQPSVTTDEDVDLVVLDVPGGADDRIELVATTEAEVVHAAGAIVALGDDVAGDPSIARDAQELATLLGAPLLRNVHKQTPLAPEVMIAVGNAQADLAGATSLIRIAPAAGKGADGALTGPTGGSLAELVEALRRQS